MLGTIYWNSSRSLQQPKKQQPGRGGAVQDCTDVPFRTGRHLHVHGVVTDRGSNPGEIETCAHGS